MIILVIGLPGSGKSYFASRLAKMLKAEYVNSDRLRKQMFPNSAYSPLEKTLVYSAMLKSMHVSITRKRNMVLDATFHKRETRNLFIKNTPVKIHFIEIWAKEPIVKFRLNKKRDYSDADFKIHQLIKKEWEPLEIPHLILESSNTNIDGMLQRAVAYLKNDAESN